MSGYIGCISYSFQNVRSVILVNTTDALVGFLSNIYHTLCCCVYACASKREFVCLMSKNVAYQI